MEAKNSVRMGKARKTRKNLKSSIHRSSRRTMAVWSYSPRRLDHCREEEVNIVTKSGFRQNERETHP